MLPLGHISSWNTSQYHYSTLIHHGFSIVWQKTKRLLSQSLKAVFLQNSPTNQSRKCLLLSFLLTLFVPGLNLINYCMMKYQCFCAQPMSTRGAIFASSLYVESLSHFCVHLSSSLPTLFEPLCTSLTFIQVSLHLLELVSQVYHSEVASSVVSKERVQPFILMVT